ncbi:hypothetical protein QTP88_027895 [Uroleucon formosanum]
MPPTPGRNRFASLSITDYNATTFTSTNNKAVSPTTHQSQPKKPKQSTSKSPPLSPLSINQLPLINDIDMKHTSGTTYSPPNTQFATKAISSTGAHSFSSEMQPNKPVTFGPNYTGSLHLIISSTENQNIGNLHPVKLGKLFISNFESVTNVMPISSHRVKISLNSITNTNTCLRSPWLQENNYSATISSSLIFSLGVISLDLCVSDEDFRESLEFCYEVVEFRRINIKRDNNLIPTKNVEIKFHTPQLPDNFSIFKAKHVVSPSIRSPKPVTNVSLPFNTSPHCFNCKLDHIASDRSCSEWSAQWEIKKIMAVENKSYAEAAQIKRSGTVYKSQSYTDVSNQNKVTFLNSNSNSVQEVSSTLPLSSFPHPSNLQYIKKRKHFGSSKFNSFQFPLSQPQHTPSYFPNGSFFNFVDQPIVNDLQSNFIESLTEQISSAILQSVDSQINFPSSHKSLIGSSLLKFLSPRSDDDDTY